MKRLIIGLCVVLALFGAICLGISHLDSFIGEMISKIELAQDYAAESNFASAAKSLQEAKDIWDSNETYTHICIRHSEINDISDAFFEVFDSLSNEDGQERLISIEKLKDKLQAIQMMEHPSLKTIF